MSLPLRLRLPQTAAALLVAVLTACGGKSDSKPTITTQPTSTTTVVGRTATFTAAADGKPTPSLVWQKDGVDITSQTTGTCTISDVKLTDAGDYTMVAKNDEGTATSHAATLTVLAVPDIQNPFGVVVDGSGNIFVSDSVRHVVHKLASTGEQTALYGTLNYAGSVDASGTSARFNSPQGLAADSLGNVYVADYDNHTIRMVSAAGAVSTVAGTAGEAGSVDATAASARFNHPIGLAISGDDQSLYVADSGNHTLRRIDLETFAVTTFAGTSGSSGSGNGTPGRFSSPNGLAIDASGNLYVADYGNSTIRMVTPAGAVSTLAGEAGTSGVADGTGSAAHFHWPVGIAWAGDGVLLVADTTNHAIRRVTTAGVTTTHAGVKGTAGNKDATGTSAYFRKPMGIWVDGSGNAFVADYGNSLIRLIDTEKVVTTLTTP